MQSTMTIWTHALAALLFGLLAVTQLRHGGSGLPRATFIVALAATALWSLAVAGVDARDVSTRVAETVRNIAWLAFLYALVRRDPTNRALGWLSAVYAIVALVMVASAVLAIAATIVVDPRDALAIASARIAFRMLAAVAALLLVHHLHIATASAARGGVRLATLALAVFWSIDLAIYASMWLSGRFPAILIDARGAMMIALAPVFAIAVQRDGNWTLRVSRTVAYQSLSVLVVGLYVVATAVVTGSLAALGGEHARLIQTAFVFGTTAALLTIVSTPWLRASAKVIVAKHLFTHRYDYRNEWLRFTETLGAPGGDAAALDVRIVKAVADLTDSPAGLLLLPHGNGCSAAAGWNWTCATLAMDDECAPLFGHLAATHRIVELDAIRGGTAPADDTVAVPAWLLAHPGAWAIVPLLHFGKLAGAIVLERPPIDRALDWEDFDLLGVAGRQAASYLAEARAHQALAEAQRFDEFNRRFAFIMHDLKNLVSQLTLVARNAERHADNPAFRADMIATLKDSSARMNALLARLSQHHHVRAEPPRATPIAPLLDRIARTRRAQHPVHAESAADTTAIADPTALEVLLGHLVQNAIEASAPDAPVILRASYDRQHVSIEVIDRGCGMTPGFVRDELFKPFVSAKDGGFGLGAFEARQLAEAMGGSVDVISREGEGTCFQITLPAAVALESLGKAA